MKILVKLVYRGVIGAVMLFAVNLAGGLFSFHLSFNIMSIFVAGFLGVPGVGLLTVLKYMLA